MPSITVPITLNNRREAFEFYMSSSGFRAHCGNCYNLKKLINCYPIDKTNDYIGFKKYAYNFLNNVEINITDIINVYTEEHHLTSWICPILNVLLSGYDNGDQGRNNISWMWFSGMMNDKIWMELNKLYSYKYLIPIAPGQGEKKFMLPVIRLPKSKHITNNMLLAQRATLKPCMLKHYISPDILVNQHKLLKPTTLRLILNSNVLIKQYESLKSCFPTIKIMKLITDKMLREQQLLLKPCKTRYIPIITGKMLREQKLKLVSYEQTLEDVLPNDVKDRIMRLYNQIKCPIIRASIDKHIRDKYCRN